MSRQLQLAARPEGTDFELVTTPIPEPGEGELVVEITHVPGYQQAIAEMARWIVERRLRSVEDTVAGDIEMFPGILARLFSGQNTGKLALELRSTRGQT